jgi:hypothetical protein
MAKPDFKKLMVEKGEKIGLGIAGGLMLLLMVIGVMNVADVPESGADEFPKKIDAKTTAIKSSINGEGVAPKKVPLEQGAYPFNEVARAPEPPRQFFNPVAPPDDRRTNPQVLGMSEIYARPELWKIPAFDIVDINGEPHIAVLKVSADSKEDQKALGNAIKDLGVRVRKPRRPAPAQNNGQNGGGIMGNPQPPVAGGQMGMGGGQMGMGSGPKPPGFGLMGGGPQPPGGNMGMGSAPRTTGGNQQAGGNTEPGQRFEVQYVKIDDKALEGKRLAFTVYPKRVVVVQASFPYKEQLEEIKKALRLDKLSDVFTTPDATPLFDGVIVQRRMMGRDGKPTEWEEFDYAESYKAIVQRRFDYVPEDPKFAHVLLGDVHQLVVPLPLLMKGEYPMPDTALPPDPLLPDQKTFLPTIKATLDAFASKQPVAPPPPPSRLKGEQSIFDRGTGVSKSLIQNQPKVDAGAGQDGFRIPTGMKKDGPTTPAGTSKDQYEPPDHILVRIVDADVEPGVVYEYRMQVRMVNPNWAGNKDKETGKYEKATKFELMSRASDAEIEYLPRETLDPDQTAGKRSPQLPAAHRWDNDVVWNRAPTAKVRFPQESFFYATEPPAVDPKEKKKDPHELRAGQGVIQFQRWMPSVKLAAFEEPVGDWVVADVVVTRGQFVGGKQFVTLPLWSSEFNRYILRDINSTIKKSKEPPRRGVEMDPASSLPHMLCVEVEGGKQSVRINKVLRDDDSAYEILLMTEDGGLQVHKSFDERQDQFRKEREALWNTWITTIDQVTDKLNPKKDDPTKPKGKFD